MQFLIVLAFTVAISAAPLKHFNMEEHSVATTTSTLKTASSDQRKAVGQQSPSLRNMGKLPKYRSHPHNEYHGGVKRSMDSIDGWVDFGGLDKRSYPLDSIDSVLGDFGGLDKKKRSMDSIERAIHFGGLDKKKRSMDLIDGVLGDFGGLDKRSMDLIDGVLDFGGLDKRSMDLIDGVLGDFGGLDKKKKRMDSIDSVLGDFGGLDKKKKRMDSIDSVIGDFGGLDKREAIKALADESRPSRNQQHERKSERLSKQNSKREFDSLIDPYDMGGLGSYKRAPIDSLDQVGFNELD